MPTFDSTHVQDQHFHFITTQNFKSKRKKKKQPRIFREIYNVEHCVCMWWVKHEKHNS